MQGILAVVLAGGKGSRLEPLTRDRAKPAVPFGGAYRIIDFTLSNCINSGVRKILVLTQYKAMSLDRHIKGGVDRWASVTRGTLASRASHSGDHPSCEIHPADAAVIAVRYEQVTCGVHRHPARSPEAGVDGWSVVSLAGK